MLSFRLLLAVSAPSISLGAMSKKLWRSRFRDSLSLKCQAQFPRLGLHTDIQPHKWRLRSSYQRVMAVIKHLARVLWLHLGRDLPWGQRWTLEPMGEREVRLESTKDQEESKISTFLVKKSILVQLQCNQVQLLSTKLQSSPKDLLSQPPFRIEPTPSRLQDFQLLNMESQSLLPMLLLPCLMGSLQSRPRAIRSLWNLRPMDKKPRATLGMEQALRLR